MDAKGAAELLRLKVEKDFSGIKQAAWRLKMHDEYLRKQIAGTQPLSKKAMEYLGLQRIVTYSYEYAVPNTDGDRGSL